MSNLLYQSYQDLLNHNIQENSEQKRIIEILHDDYGRLTHGQQQSAPPSKQMRNWYSNLREKLGLRGQRSTNHRKAGLYLWGGVGTGKTMLARLFSNALKDKIFSMHFNQFMSNLHEQIHANRKKTLEVKLSYQNARKLAKSRILEQESTISQVVNDMIPGKYLAVFIDELYVEDIGDAILMKQVFKAFAARNLYILITSNSVPEKLYLNGFQRQKFLPAIAWINEYCRVEKIDHGLDYRAMLLEIRDLFFDNPERDFGMFLKKILPRFNIDQSNLESVILMNRSVPCIKKHTTSFVHGTEASWICFDFKQICSGKRSYRDYIELCRNYHLIVVLDLPKLSDESLDDTRRFISFIDQVYYNKCALVLQSSSSIASIYGGKQLRFSMQRCLSRLSEIRSMQWFEMSQWMEKSKLNIADIE